MTTSNGFVGLGVPETLASSLAERGITEPFPIQSATIPDGLAGRDLCGRAPAGSGKTIAFGLSVLARVGRGESHRPRALVLAPTRELADQIRGELAHLAQAVDRRVLAVYGGMSYGPQRRELRRGIDILVACPGRLEDLIAQGIVDLGKVDIVVVDEADRMADMGFLPAVRRLLDATSSQRQTLLFSATLDGDVAVLSKDYQHDPARHEVDTVEAKLGEVSHHFWKVERPERLAHAKHVIDHAGPAIVFTRTRHGADRLARQLARTGVAAVAMHGGRSQGQRARALEAFSSGRARALVATDVAARGIHVDQVGCVVHFDLPGDRKTYLHRSGRTGRAGAAGTVVSLVGGNEVEQTRLLQRSLGLDVPVSAPSGLGAGEGGPIPRPSRRGERPRGESTRLDAARPDSGTRSLYVANLAYAMTAADLRELFAGFGEVRSATIITNRRTGRSRGFGFVEMPAHAAGEATQRLRGSRVRGRQIQVSEARPRHTRA